MSEETLREFIDESYEVMDEINTDTVYFVDYQDGVSKLLALVNCGEMIGEVGLHEMMALFGTLPEGQC